jgi:hypothetical protein
MTAPDDFHEAYNSFHMFVVRSVRLQPDFTGPPEGGHYGKPWADRATVVKNGRVLSEGSSIGPESKPGGRTMQTFRNSLG